MVLVGRLEVREAEQGVAAAVRWAAFLVACKAVDSLARMEERAAADYKAEIRELVEESLRLSVAIHLKWASP